MSAPFAMSASRICHSFRRHFRRLHGLSQELRNSKEAWRQARVNIARTGTCLALALPITTVHTFSIPGWSKKTTEEKPAEVSRVEDRLSLIVKEADRLYDCSEVFALYDYLIQYKNEDNDEILWRLARAAVDKGKNSGQENLKRELYYEAFAYIQKALTLNDNNSATHKWYAILLDYTGEYEGTKQRISNAYHVKEHFLKAIQLNPKDATSIHSLGYWCFVFADMPWYQKTVASALFATPPSSTYEEALKYFKQAEESYGGPVYNILKGYTDEKRTVRTLIRCTLNEIYATSVAPDQTASNSPSDQGPHCSLLIMDPNFYSTNLLMLGKTYMKLRDAKNAYIFLVRCRDLPVKTPDDRKAHDEAKKLLSSMGLKDKVTP